MISALPLAAQPCLNIEWDVTIGGSDNDIVRSAAVMPDGRYILAGATNSPMSDEVGEPGYGLFDAWAVCLEQDGSIVWERRYGGSAGDQFESVAVTPDGGLVFAGLTASPVSGTVSQPRLSTYGMDFWVVRTDAAGEVLWDRRFGGSGMDMGRTVIAVSDGTFIVAGLSDSPVSGTKTSPPHGGFDYWVIGVDEAGNQQWDNCLGGNANENFRDATARPGGGAVLVGTSNSVTSGDISEPRRGNSDVWTVAIDEVGTKLWDKRFGGLNQASGNAVAKLGQHYIVAGYTNSPVGHEVTMAPYGIGDGWAYTLTGTGGGLDDRRLGGTFIDDFRSVAVLDPSTEGSKIAFAGAASSDASGTITGIPRGDYDYWLTILTHNNTIDGQFRCGTAQADELTKVLLTPDGGYLLVGNSGADAGWDKTHDSRGGAFDMWIVKVGPSLGSWWYADADGDGFGTPFTSVFACEPPVGYVRNDRDCDDTDPTRYIGAPCTDALGDPGVLDPGCNCVAEPSTVTLPVVMGLEGPMDEVTGLMDDDLRGLDLLPAVEPYTMLGLIVTENSYFQADPAAFLVTGAKAIVDWVLVELRSANDPTLLMASRAGLLQRDGTVVMTDGVSPFIMNAPMDDYYVAVRHRNHLGVMTTFPVAVNSQTQLIDLRDPQYPVHGSDPRVIKGGTACLWAGDVNGDGVVRYTGLNNDRDGILIEVGGTVPTATAPGYMSADLNMDGVVKYVGAQNDRDVILQSIGGVVPTAVRVGQLP